MALLDADPDAGLRFRCALVKPSGGVEGEPTMAFSSDSTCSRDLFSASLGHEVLRLREIPQRPLPNLVRKGTCRLV